MLIAFPPDLRKWIENKAERNLQTMNSAIVMSLRSQMDTEQERARAGRSTKRVAG
jgi:hypothetical protein